MKKYTFVQLLEGLDSLFADYGGREIEFPEHIEDCNGEYSSLTEEEAKEVFELNDGDIESVIEYLEFEE